MTFLQGKSVVMMTTADMPTSTIKGLPGGELGKGWGGRRVGSISAGSISAMEFSKGLTEARPCKDATLDPY